MSGQIPGTGAEADRFILVKALVASPPALLSTGETEARGCTQQVGEV
jgi:hypothetical protein